MRRTFLIVCLLGLASLAWSQNASFIQGTWKGTVDAGTGPLDIYFTLTDRDGTLAADLSVPAQGAHGIPVDRITFDGVNLSLELDALQMKYSGMLLMGSVAGKLSQYGMEFPVTLVRGEIPRPKRPQEPKGPFPYEVREVVFENGYAGHSLAGTLTLPSTTAVGANGPKPLDAVVLVSGSGAQNRDEELMGHKPFLVLADALTRSGFAVLRYDDRGVGASGGVHETATTQDFASDAQAALDYLNTLPEIGRVGILGHSEGAAIAFLVASGAVKEDTACDFVISFAGPGVSGKEILLSQQRRIYTLSGLPDHQVEQILRVNASMYDLVLESRENDEALHQQVLSMLGDPALVQQLLNPWMYAFIRYSPQEALRKVRVPVLAFNGTKDVQVLWDLNLPAIEAALKEGGNQQVQIVPLEGLNHLGQHCQTGVPQEYAQIEETLAPEVVDTILRFLAGL